MPLKLNIAERTTVEQTFIDVMIDMWKDRWKALNDEILKQPPGMRDFIAKKNAVPMNNLKAQIKGGTVFDFQKTQLMCLPFVKFFTLEHRGALWLAGLTRPITLTDGGPRRWQGPRYTIYVPRNVIARGTSADFHWVPEGRELEYARHPHHNAYRGSANHPLDMDPNTCWGEFPTIVSSCVRAGDVVSLFRTLHLYATRVNMSSLLTHPFDATPFKPLPNATPEPTPPPARRARR